MKNLIIAGVICMIAVTVTLAEAEHYQLGYMPGNNMEPTIAGGTVLFWHATVPYEDLKAGDVVFYVDENGTSQVSRISLIVLDNMIVSGDNTEDIVVESVERERYLGLVLGHELDPRLPITKWENDKLPFPHFLALRFHDWSVEYDMTLFPWQQLYIAIPDTEIRQMVSEWALCSGDRTGFVTAWFGTVNGPERLRDIEQRLDDRISALNMTGIKNEINNAKYGEVIPLIVETLNAVDANVIDAGNCIVNEYQTVSGILANSIYVADKYDIKPNTTVYILGILGTYVSPDQ